MRTRDEALHKRRKSEILRAAAKCFAAKGVHQASMQEICDTAGISAGALYRYFESKEAIIVALADEERAENAELIAHLSAADDIVDGLCEVVPEIIAVLRNEQYGRLAIEIGAEATRNPVIAEVFERNESELRRALSDALERGQKCGAVDPALDVQAMVFLVLALFDGIPGRSIFDEKILREQIAETLQRFLRKALRNA